MKRNKKVKKLAEFIARPEVLDLLLNPNAIDRVKLIKKRDELDPEWRSKRTWLEGLFKD